MNYDHANGVKELAPKVYEGMKRLDVECPECKGMRMVEGPAKIDCPDDPIFGDSLVRNIPIKCQSCNGTGKIKWKWQPQVGEWCIRNDRVVLIIKTLIDSIQVTPWMITDPECRAKNVIPILEWEKIEEVLEKAGYKVSFESYYDRRIDKCYRVWVGSLPCTDEYTMQKAVYKAMIALRKELG